MRNVTRGSLANARDDGAESHGILDSAGASFSKTCNFNNLIKKFQTDKAKKHYFRFFN